MKAQPASLRYTAEHSVAPIATFVETGGTTGRRYYGHSCEGAAICNDEVGKPARLRGDHYAWKGEVVVLHGHFPFCERDVVAPDLTPPFN